MNNTNTAQPVIHPVMDNKSDTDKKTNVIHAVLNGKYDADFVLQIIKDKKGESSGILSVPFVDWLDSETSFVSNRVLNIKGRELECIKNNFFDKNLVSLPVENYPQPVEMCDILYKVIPPEIYNRLLSNTFQIDKKADPEFYGIFLNNDKQDSKNMTEFLELAEKNKINLPYIQKNILYAKKIKNIPSGEPSLFITINKSVTSKIKYDILIHNITDGSSKSFITDDIYIAKKIFDRTNTYSDYKKTSHNFTPVNTISKRNEKKRGRHV